MLVTLSGMVMLVKVEHPENAESPIVVPLVNTTVVKLVLGIAEIAIAGIIAVVMLLHPPNA